MKSEFSNAVRFHFHAIQSEWQRANAGARGRKYGQTDAAYRRAKGMRSVFIDKPEDMPPLSAFSKEKQDAIREILFRALAREAKQEKTIQQKAR